MPSDNEEVVRRVYRAWNDDDFEAAHPAFHPEVEWHTSGIFPGLEPVYHGIEGVRVFWATMKDAWTYFTIDIESTEALGDWIVTSVHFEAVGRESGVKVESAFAHSFRVQEERVTVYRSFPALADARAFVLEQEKGQRP